MKTKLLIAAGMLWLMSWQVYAQDSVQISLDKAIDMSLENSKQLKIAYAKIQESEAQLAQVRQRQFPSVNMGGAYLRVNSPHIETHFTLPSSGSDNQGEKEAMAAPEVSQATYGTVNLTQPIFSGLKIRHSIESAGYLKRASELNAESQKDEVILNTMAAYYNFYKLQATRQLVEQSLEQAKQRVRIFTNLEKNGVITRNDLLKAQLQQSRMELTLLDIDNNIEVANFDLNILLGLPEETRMMVDTTQLQVVPEKVQPMAFYIQEAQNNRADLKSSANREKAAEAGVKIAKSGYFPSVALTGGYIDAYVPNLITVTNAINVGVGVQYSLSGIFDAHHKVQEARAQQNQSALAADIQLDEVKKEVFKRYADYQKSLKKIETLQVADAQAQENFRITQNNYDNNLALITDMLDAEVAKLQTQVDQLHAKADASLSFYQLEKAAGLLNKDFLNQN